MNGKGASPNVIGDPAQPSARIAIRFIGDTADLRGRIDQRSQNVDVIVGFDALQNGGCAFEAHACVNVLAGQWAQIVWGIADAVKLREDKVPDLNRTTFVIMIKDLAAWTANPVWTFARCTCRPEVVFLPHTLNPLFGQSDIIGPDLCGFRVVQIDRHGQAVGIQPDPLFVGQKLPGPVDGVALKIVSEAEVAQHFEERMVVGRSSNIVDITRSQALLARRGTREIEFYFAQEMGLELVHTRRCEKYRGVPGRNEHITRLASMALGLKET